MELAEPYSMSVQGQLILNIAPDTASTDGAANQADPRLRFQNGQTIAPFTIAAGSTKASVPLASTGTVASTVTVSIAGLRAAGADLPAVITPAVFRIAAAPPAITSACWNMTDYGLDLLLTGYSNTRELTAAKVAIDSEEFTTNLDAIAAEYFSSEETLRFGGAFTLHLPYDALGRRGGERGR